MPQSGPARRRALETASRSISSRHPSMGDEEVLMLYLANGLMLEVDDQWPEVDDQSEGCNQIRSIPTVS